MSMAKMSTKGISFRMQAICLRELCLSIVADTFLICVRILEYVRASLIQFQKLIRGLNWFDMLSFWYEDCLLKPDITVWIIIVDNNPHDTI